MTIENKNISVVVPVYNSSKSLLELHSRLISILKKISSHYEIIMVDDGSRDNSYSVMKDIRINDPNVKIIKLLKNFGQHNAVVCGFNYVGGDYIVTIDDDLQNPPEEIPMLLNKLLDGFDVVIGVPVQKKHNLLRKIGSAVIMKLCNWILGYPKEIRQSSFRILRKIAVDNIIKIKTSYPYLPGYIAQVVSFDKIVNVKIKHVKRKYGSSNYSLRRLLKLTLNLLINYSSLPLRIISIIGLLSSISSIIYGIFLIIRKLVSQTIVLEGWTSIIVLVAFIGGLILFSLGIIGEYLKRIINEISKRNQYIIDEIFIE